MERGGLEETRGQVVARRLRTVPPIVLGLLVVTALLPLLVVVAVVVDLVRRLVRGTPFMALRLLAFLWAYLAAETIGLLALLAIWVASGLGARRAWLAERTWRFQQVWAGALFNAARALFDLRVEVSGDEVVAPGPVLVLIRHASIVDNLLPSVLVARAHRIHLRYVLKRDLLSDPCLDVAGKRLPNYFVRRGTGEEVERRNVRRLAEGLGPEDGVLLYPEGTRFTEERRGQAIERLERSDPDLAECARGIRHLLAPRPGGFLALLDGAPEADVVVLAHQGFDGLRLISDIWGGALVGRTIHVRFTRTPRAAIPADRAGAVRWLFDAWSEADAWVGEQLAHEAAAAVSA
ncbi:MAG TPA: lysophospholipid acyltransferase family protein [Solirubrobacteraceae bacterium]|nr:lysophospholipid acyltransferase family protein [Solirubrobacteraceae bacterium]